MSKAPTKAASKAWQVHGCEIRCCNARSLPTTVWTLSHSLSVTHTHTHTHIHTHTHTAVSDVGDTFRRERQRPGFFYKKCSECVCACVCVRARVRVCVCLYIYIYIHTYMHTYKKIHTYKHTMCVSVSVLKLNQTSSLAGAEFAVRAPRRQSYWYRRRTLQGIAKLILFSLLPNPLVPLVPLY